MDGNLSIFGAQWGDEGKGKVVDFFCENVDIVVRFAGGNNAGHTLVVGGLEVAVHLLPSGAVRPSAICVLGAGMVIDPSALLEEMQMLADVGCSLDAKRLKLSSRAQLVLPYHRQIDALREGGPNAIGTTKRGIGPAYEDKAARRGLRAGDLRDGASLRAKLERAIADVTPQIVAAGGQPPELVPLFDALAAQAETLRPHITETEPLLARWMRGGKRVLFEGAQGAMLDIDHGTYPFVTSSTTLPAGACAGAGVAPRALGAIVGVSKAYVTRVGAGPMPSELDEAESERLRSHGGEFGATTGRARRCGWLDLPALRHALTVSGADYLALTKLDVLAAFERIKVCEAYMLDGERLAIDAFPASADELARATPVYREMAGFAGISGDERSFEALPQTARDFIAYVEQALELPVCLVSIGPQRDATIVRS
ncbi:MAG: adenylosuccinate synthase [Myxococcales bacterium]|nr:adenylosuccinate synthase [Myxococcales bacterium]